MFRMLPIAITTSDAWPTFPGASPLMETANFHFHLPASCTTVINFFHSYNNV